mgnify:CR=1 FL=1
MMGWLIAFMIVFLLAILPLGASVKYNSDGPLVRIIAGPIRFKVFPVKKKEKKDDKKEDSIGKDVTQIVGSVNNIVSGLNSLGIEVPAGIAKVLAVMQVIIGIISAIQVILAIIGVQSSIPFFAKGGIVRAAGGFQVPGNSFSGDRVPALLNSGELVLNRSQQGVLANALSGNAFDNLELTASLNGEDIVFAIDNASRRRGKGTMVRLRNG